MQKETKYNIFGIYDESTGRLRKIGFLLLRPTGG